MTTGTLKWPRCFGTRDWVVIMKTPHHQHPSIPVLCTGNDGQRKEKGEKTHHFGGETSLTGTPSLSGTGVATKTLSGMAFVHASARMDSTRLLDDISILEK